MHVNISQETSEESLYVENYRENAAAQIEPRTRAHILCEPVPSKCTSRFREPLYMEVAGETPQTKMSPERTQTQTFYCVSVRSRNACQDLTKATLCSFFFVGKMPRSRVSTLIKHRPLQLSQEPFSVDTLFGEKSWTETHT